MFSDKKLTKEDTWRSDELMKHIQGQDEENRRRERLKREESHRKQRSGESTDRRHRDGERDERREKQRERDNTRERAKHREPERDREEQRRREERERRKERERDGERRGSERRADRDEKENRDREKERQRERYKDRDREGEGDSGRYREREKERERHRERDRDDRDRLKDREKEKERYREKDRDREKERYREKERETEKHKEKDRDKDRERERRRAEREKERRREKEESRDVEEKHREKDKERERERRERHREREERHRGEEGEKREKHRESAGHADREERRERRRREKERYESDVRSLDDAQEAERRHREREKARDREERDKRREKRHEESKRSSTEQRHENKLRNTEPEVESEVIENDAEAAEDYGNADYEEDFEDYEEDFEEMEEEEEDKGGEENENEVREEKRELSPGRRKEIEAIQRAMQQENELVISAYSQTSPRRAEPAQKASADSESHLRKGRTHGRVIDFAAARQREVNQQAADKQKKRSAELLRLIDLDFSVTECLLDLPPVSEYDMYIKSFGMANTKQAYVQCNEDNTDRDTQTEETDTMDKWTQHPPETNVVCGGPKVSHNASDESLVRMSVDSKRLTTFLRSAAQVMAVLLEENRVESNSVKKLHSKTDALSFSDGCLHLNTNLPFLHGRQVMLLHFSQVQTHTLLSVHSPCSGSSAVRLDSKTLICVWNIWEPSAPQSILIYEAEVRCCCFSPGKATLVFAGTTVGSVVLWDLREHSGSHTSLRVGEEEWTLRHPTFSTDAVLSGAGHFSSVVSVEPVLINVEPGIKGPRLADQEESLGLSFQLGSLDETGLLNLWVVIELPKADDSGSQTDLGLRPGGKVKLLHSSSIQTCDRSSSREVAGVTPPLSLLLKFLPSDSNHYFIGTSMGLVQRGTRHGLRAVPKLYRSEDGERPAEVTALDFCPSGEPFFLVGCSDGTIRLHSVLREEPVLEWSTASGDAPVRAVQWSKTRPSVFCILVADSVLHIWDLTERDSSPIISESFTTDGVTTMAVFGEAARQNRYSGVALAKQSGRLEIHFLKQSLTVPQPSDTEKLHLLAQDNL